MKFGIQLGIKNNIWIGNINKKGTMFLQKEDKTVAVLNEVIKMIRNNDEDGLTTELADDKYRYIISLKTVKRD